MIYLKHCYTNVSCIFTIILVRNIQNKYKGYTCPGSFILLWTHPKEIVNAKMMRPKSIIVKVDKANKTMQN